MEMKQSNKVQVPKHYSNMRCTEGELYMVAGMEYKDMLHNDWLISHDHNMEYDIRHRIVPKLIERYLNTSWIQGHATGTWNMRVIIVFEVLGKYASHLGKAYLEHLEQYCTNSNKKCGYEYAPGAPEPELEYVEVDIE